MEKEADDKHEDRDPFNRRQNSHSVSDNQLPQPTLLRHPPDFRHHLTSREAVLRRYLVMRLCPIRPPRSKYPGTSADQCVGGFLLYCMSHLGWGNESVFLWYGRGGGLVGRSVCWSTNVGRAGWAALHLWRLSSKLRGGGWEGASRWTKTMSCAGNLSCPKVIVALVVPGERVILGSTTRGEARAHGRVLLGSNEAAVAFYHFTYDSRAYQTTYVFCSWVGKIIACEEAQLTPSPHPPALSLPSFWSSLVPSIINLRGRTICRGE